MNIDFTQRELDGRLKWYCEPVEWSVDEQAGQLHIVTDGDTDYWQRTHYGFRRDNGHFLYAETQGDLELETRVRYQPLSDFDQAGLMVRFSAEEWIKTSVEMERDGSYHLGVVVTRGGYSDWSTQLFPSGPVDISLRVCRVAHDYAVYWHTAASGWVQLRMAHLDPPTGAAPLLCGLYAASPASGGCSVRFAYLRITHPSGPD